METTFDWREFFGTLATRGQRPFLAWSLTLVLTALGAAFVYRFAMGSITSQDLVILVPMVAPLMQQLWQRHVEVKAGFPNETGAMGPGAQAGA